MKVEALVQVINSRTGAPFVFDTRQQWVQKQEWSSFATEQFYDGRSAFANSLQSQRHSLELHNNGITSPARQKQTIEAFRQAILENNTFWQDELINT